MADWIGHRTDVFAANTKLAMMRYELEQLEKEEVVQDYLKAKEMLKHVEEFIADLQAED